MNHTEVTIEELLEQAWLELDYLICEGIADREMRQLQKDMIHYLATFSISDGDHQHLSYGVLTAVDYPAAFTATLTHEHTMEQDKADKYGMSKTTWGFCDGLTSSDVLSVKEITQEQHQALLDTEVALNLDKVAERKAL